MINWLGERYCATNRLKTGLQVKVTTLSLLKNLTVFSNCCSMLTSIKLRVQILVGGGASLFQVFMFTKPFGIVYFLKPPGCSETPEQLVFSISSRLHCVEDKACMKDTTFG